MEIMPYEFTKAHDGSLFVKKGNKLVAVSIEELTKDIQRELLKISKLESEIASLKKTLTLYKKDSKYHFLVAFNTFKQKVMTGEVAIEDDSLFTLDEKVMSNELTVSEAITKHDYLYELYTKCFDNEDELVGITETKEN